MDTKVIHAELVALWKQRGLTFESNKPAEDWRPRSTTTWWITNKSLDNSTKRRRYLRALARSCFQTCRDDGRSCGAVESKWVLEVTIESPCRPFADIDGVRIAIHRYA